MHPSSMQNMRKCFDKHIGDLLAADIDSLHVVDVGSMDVNGSYREIFHDPRVRYTGIDLTPGRGVDLVISDPYRFPLPDQSADVVLCGQMLEHCEFFWRAFEEMARLLKPGGLLVLITPSRGEIHRYPVDCYRFLPDSYQVLAKLGGCPLIDWWLDDESGWGDLVGVFRRPAVQNPILAETVMASDDANVNRHEGVPYEQFLMQYQRFFGPRAHLEIGTYEGRSLALMACPAIAVDPNFTISDNVIGAKERMFFFQMNSDRFFEDFDPTHLLGRKLDTAFLDGMHLFEFLLRDFMNTERHCSDRAVIFLHDCLPITAGMAVRDTSMARTDTEFRQWWTGDVWKMIPVLRRYRPDLSIHCFDCPPTGLVAVTNLDPSSSVLRDQYSRIVREFVDETMDDSDIGRFLEECAILDSSQSGRFEWMSRLFS